jgi:hypothetical protein
MTGSSYKTVVIPAAVAGTPGVVSQEVSGSVFYCVAATASFLIRVADQGAQTMSAGRTFGSPSAPGRGFGSLTFENTSGSAITVTYWVGYENFVADPTVNVSTGEITATMSNTLAGAAAASPTQFAKTVASAGTPESLTAGASNFRKALLYAYKTVARGANTGNVRIGVGPAASSQIIQLSPGDEYIIEAPTGAKFDFQDWYIDADNNGDGVVVLYS